MAALLDGLPCQFREQVVELRRIVAHPPKMFLDTGKVGVELPFDACRLMARYGVGEDEHLVTADIAAGRIVVDGRCAAKE